MIGWPFGKTEKGFLFTLSTNVRWSSGSVYYEICPMLIGPPIPTPSHLKTTQFTPSLTFLSTPNTFYSIYQNHSLQNCWVFYTLPNEVIENFQSPCVRVQRDTKLWALCWGQSCGVRNSGTKKGGVGGGRLEEFTVI